MADDSIPSGQMTPEDQWGEFNRQTFVIQQLINRIQTATLVRVDAVTNSGDVSPVGFVDVTPLVNQVDSDGLATPHATIYNVPYLRMQGGANAIILDPQVGDKGLCCFASRDISKVKNTGDQANPGSFRKYDWADALYVGGMLNGTPTQYVQFSTAGIKMHSPTAVMIEAPTVQVNATVSASVTAPVINLGAVGQTLKAFMTSAFQTIFNNHTHVSNGTGVATTTPNVTTGASEITTTVKGG